MAVEVVTPTAPVVPPAPPPPAAPAAKPAAAPAAAPAVVAKPATPAATGPSDKIRDLILARANQFTKEQELRAREQKVESKETPATPAAPAAEAQTPDPAKPATPAAAPIDPQLEALWKEETGKMVEGLKAKPKYGPLAALGLLEQVPQRMLSHYQEKNEHRSEEQIAEEMLGGVKTDFKALLSHPNLKGFFEELWTEIHPAGAAAEKPAGATEAAPGTTDPAKLTPMQEESFMAFRKRQNLASPPTLSNKTPSAPAGTPPEELLKPLPNESFLKFRARQRAAGMP